MASNRKKKHRGWVLSKALVYEQMKLAGVPNQQELADHTGLDYWHLSKLIDGSPWNHKTLSRLCGALQCTPQDILTKGEEMV
jgi:DNA-binding Xre family transcriptional regulator